MKRTWQRIRDGLMYRKEPELLHHEAEATTFLVQRIDDGFKLIWISDKDDTSIRAGITDEQARYLIGKLEEHL